MGVRRETALDPASPVIHPDLGDNLAFERRVEAGDVDAAFATANVVVEETFHFGRHTGVTLEPRITLADYNAGDGKLTVYMTTQAPHAVRTVLALVAGHVGLSEEKIRIIDELCYELAVFNIVEVILQMFVRFEVADILDAPGRKIVEQHDVVAAIEEPFRQMGTDKACTTGDQIPHVVSF